MTDEPDKTFALVFDPARPAGELQTGEIVVVDGHVLAVEYVADDPERVRLVLASALGPPPGTNPDQREIELICPRDTVPATARPHDVELAPSPARA